MFAVACTLETRYAVRMWYNRTCSEGFCITQEIGLYCYFGALFSQNARNKRLMGEGVSVHHQSVSVPAKYGFRCSVPL